MIYDVTSLKADLAELTIPNHQINYHLLCIITQFLQEFSMNPTKSLISNQLLPGSSIVNEKYRILHQIYGGNRSKVYSLSFNREGQRNVRVIKIQNVLGSNHAIKNQVNTYKSLFYEKNKIEHHPGFPRMFQFGIEKGFTYTVMEICGPNLAHLLKLCGGKFSKKTVILIGLQLIDRIELLHDKNFLYLNFSAQNFVVGLGSESQYIKMIDFSQCQLFRSRNKNVHVSYQTKSNDLNPLFSSLNSQLSIQPTRKDDIESLLYLLVFLFKGKLPWSRVQAPSFKQMCQQILKIKSKISPESLMKGLSIQFVDMFYYVRTLSFYEKPNYNFLRKKLWGALVETEYEELKKNIIMYDWDNRESLDYDIYRDNPKIRKMDEENMFQHESDNESDRDLLQNRSS